MSTIDQDIRKLLIHLPILETLNGRQAFLRNAELDESFIQQINCDQPPTQFVSHLLNHANHYGTLVNNQPALIALLQAVKSLGGREIQAECDRLIAATRDARATSDAAPAIPWNVPFQPNPYFTGREAILQQLREALRRNNRAALSQTQAISGLGGIGKTQTAVQYAYLYKSEYTAVLWVVADATESLLSGFTALARVLNLPEQSEKEQPRIVTAVKRYFETHSGWLLICDNADDPALLKPCLPLNPQGHIIITSRARVLDQIGVAAPLLMEKMPPDEAQTFLLTRTGRADLSMNADEQAALKQLLAEFDGLPLALEQAGAYIKETECRFESYLTEYRRAGFDLLAKHEPVVGTHQDPVARTWRLNFEQARQENPHSADALRLYAFLYPDAIPFELFAGFQPKPMETPSTPSWFGRITGRLFKTTTPDNSSHAEIWNDSVLTPLTRFYLLRRDPATQTVTMHRLVQAAVQHEMTDEERQHWAEQAVLAVESAFPPGKDILKIQNWPRCERLLSQALRCAALIERWQFETPAVARLLHLTAHYLHEHAAHYAEAEPLLQRALQIREKLFGAEHPDVAMSLNDLAGLYQAQGRYAQAEPLLQRALQIREKLFSAEHPDVAMSLNNLAMLYQDQGRYAQAEPLLQRALQIHEKFFGAEHPDVAGSLSNLATFYQAKGHYAQAKPLLQRALQIYEKVFGIEHPNVAGSLRNLATIYLNQGRYAQAEPLLQRALQIYEKVFGAEHPNVATSLNNLAGLYQDQGHYAQAEPLFKRALQIYETVFGIEHPNVAGGLRNLAALYQNQRRYTKAEPLLQRALQIYEKLFGAEHPDVATSLNNLAMLYQDQGRYAQAKPLLQRALKINEKALGTEHPIIAAGLNNLAAVYQAQRHYAKAELLLKRALKIYENALGVEHPDVAITLYNLAALYGNQGRHAKAKPLYQQAIAIAEKTLPADHPNLTRYREGYANLLAAIQRSRNNRFRRRP